jgi:hypothetical protein
MACYVYIKDTLEFLEIPYKYSQIPERGKKVARKDQLECALKDTAIVKSGRNKKYTSCSAFLFVQTTTK